MLRLSVGTIYVDPMLPCICPAYQELLIYLSTLLTPLDKFVKERAAHQGLLPLAKTLI